MTKKVLKEGENTGKNLIKYVGVEAFAKLKNEIKNLKVSCIFDTNLLLSINISFFKQYVRMEL